MKTKKSPNKEQSSYLIYRSVERTKESIIAFVVGVRVVHCVTSSRGLCVCVCVRLKMVHYRHAFSLSSLFSDCCECARERVALVC